MSQIKTPAPLDADYGFDDSETRDHIIQGDILKCADGQWLTKEGAAVSPDLRLLVLGIKHAAQRWEGQMPVETILPPLPDVDELNAVIPREKWEPGLDGKPRPPWCLQYLVYLLNPVDASMYTYVNSTTGARIATEKLASRVQLMRQIRGAKVLPVVRLGTAPMKTRFGVKVRPEFDVVDWTEFAPSPPAISKTATPTAITDQHDSAADEVELPF